MYDIPTDKQDAIDELTDAIRLTVEYVGLDILPPVIGWSWFDALTKYAPDQAEVLHQRYVMMQQPRK